MSSCLTSLPDALADVILRQYHSLPKTGKPQPNEYTVLAGLAVSMDAPSCSRDSSAFKGSLSQAQTELPDSRAGDGEQYLQLVPVVLGTGTKCLGARQGSHELGVIYDSHAEVSSPPYCNSYCFGDMILDVSI